MGEAAVKEALFVTVCEAAPVLPLSRLGASPVSVFNVSLGWPPHGIIGSPCETARLKAFSVVA